jgi:glycosyltransferase involved in cell wall biosynthesis
MSQQPSCAKLPRMVVLFLHQNFPGQFLHVAAALQASGAHRLLALIPTDNRRPAVIPVRHYRWQPAEPRWRGELGGHYVDCASRASAVADALQALKSEGFTPDLVVGHGGWGETLFVRDVWRDVPILLHAEFYYRGYGQDVGFDPETSHPDPTRAALLARARSAVMLQALTDASHGVAPTRWQARTFPDFLQSKIDVLHEGVDTDRVRPDAAASLTLRRDGVTLRPGDEIVTYVARNLEHYRGFHIFMRALSAVLAARPKARAVIVGGDDVSYGPRPAPGKTWRRAMLAEQSGLLDMSRVHFVGRVPYPRFVQLMQVSAAHVYLTYPFVLSWSMLEAMSAGGLVIGSRTGPVEEVIQDRHNGLLRDFFDVRGIADAMIEALATPARFAAMRRAARQTILNRYDLRRICLPGWLRLIDRVAHMR